MPITSISDMVVVPEKFAAYVEDRTVEKSSLVNSGIATSDATVAQLINGMPKGGRFIEIPAWNELGGEPSVFGESKLSATGITTKSWQATLQIWQKAWGATDLSRVLGGADPMAAIANLIADWRNIQEQKIYLAILKALLDPTSGAIKAHINDISSKTGNSGADAYISDGATLDTKQVLGDRYSSLGMVFMHSAVYTYLQKNGMITRNPIFDPSQSSIEMERYLGYTINVDDGMPYTCYTAAESSASGAIAVTTENISEIQPHCATELTAGTSYVTKGAAVYDTYFLGGGAFIRETGTPEGLKTVETDRDTLGAEDYLINRWAQIIHPRGFSWNVGATLANSEKYPSIADLGKAANWTLATNAKKVPIACLRHKIG